MIAGLGGGRSSGTRLVTAKSRTVAAKVTRALPGKLAQ